VLLNGDHAAIETWRREQSHRITEERRADLLLGHAGPDVRSPERTTEGKPWIE
jgi:tRNA G37 N-methylase TrmD